MVAVLAGLIVAPSFIDWTPYRETFARQLSNAVGRPVSIDGSVTFALVPRPALEAGGVRVGDGAERVTIAAVKAWLSFLPLLTGDLHFQDIRLDDAVGVITLDVPWSEPRSEARGTSMPAPSPQPLTVNVDRIALNGGDLRLHDRGGADLLRAQNMDLVFSREGRDRFKLAGDLRFNGQPMSVEAELGAAGGDGVRALSVSARVPAAETSIAASGRVSVLKRSFDGDVSIKGERGAALFSGLGLPVRESPALARTIVLSAKASADETGVAFNDVTLNAGGASAKGAVEWRHARTPQLTVRFDFAPFSLDDWVPTPLPQAVTPAAASSPVPAPSPQGEHVTSTLTGDFVVRLPAFSARGQSLRDGNIAATLAAGELKVSEFSATLPGTTRLSAFGLITFAQTAPSIDGIISLQTFDTRGFVSWLGADVSDIPPGRLGSASLQGAVQGNFDFLALNDIEGALDTARIAGRLSYAPRARPFIGVDLRIDNVNFDSYRAAPAVPAVPVAPAPTVAAAPTPARAPEVYGITASGAAFSGLGAFDAEVRIEAAGVTAGGLPGGRAGLDLGLRDGKLDIRTASFEKIAGTTAWFSGAIAGFGAALQFNNLQFDVAGDDIARLASVMGVDLAPALNALGPTSLTGTLNGGAVQADVAATLKAAGLTARATGHLMDLDKAPRFNGQIEAAHPRFSDLMKATSVSWPTALRDPGALALQARIAQDGDKTSVTEARVSVGKDRVAGTAAFTRVDGKMRVTAALSDIALDLDRILPPAADASRPAAPSSGAPRTAAVAPSAPAGPSSPWSQDVVTWSFLKDWSGEISAAGTAFNARGLQVQDFSVRILVADGAAELADWDGKVFGAPGQVGLRIAATPEPSVQGQLAVKGADFRALIAALNGGRTNLKSSGTADVTASFGARGTSAAGFANTFSGAGALSVSATETGTGLSAGLLGPLNAAAQLDVGTPGKPAPITFSARVAADNGVVKLENAEISSRSHTGRFNGVLNLPRRQVNVSGALVPRKAGEEQLPISITGAMDRPTIRLLPPPR